MELGTASDGVRRLVVGADNWAARVSGTDSWARALAAAQAGAPKARDWIDYSTLVIAVLGALTGTVALLWQFLQWRLSSHRVRVSAAYGFGAAPGAPQDELARVIGAEAVNVGRAAVNVSSWGFNLADGSGVHPMTTPESTDLPHRLEPGAAAKFYAAEADLRVYADRSPRPFVRLATGEVLVGEPVKFG